MNDYVADYWRDGYVIVRGVFSKAEVASIAAAADRLYDEGLAHGRSFRHGNLFYNVAEDQAGQAQVRMAQWPSYHIPAFNDTRLDPRFAQLLDPLIGSDLKQIINQVHWKAPNSMSDFAWHQDARFRKPSHAYRNLGDAYVQTGLAIDPHTQESGCLRFIPGSHANGTLPLDQEGEVIGNAPVDDALLAVGLDPASAVNVLLEPGDLALWSPYLVHASGTNQAEHRRRLFINGYVRANDCDRGEWAFRAGQPVPLGPEPALVHYEDLKAHPHPHYT